MHPRLPRFHRARRHALAASFATLVMATSTAPAFAQDAQTQAMGRALFNEAVTLFNKGDYEAACPKFEASLKHYPGLGTRGKLAECYERQGRFASAYAVYREVAQLATRSGDPTREQIASERAKGLEPKLSYLTLVIPSQNELPGMVVKRNGREVDRAKLRFAEPVDAGTITIEASAPGRKTFTAQASVIQGQSLRFEVPALEVATSPGLIGTAPPPPTTTAEEPSTIHGDPPGWQKPLGFVLVGLGVVGMGVGGVLGLSAKSKYDGAFDGGGCDKGSKQCDPAGQATVDDARAKATLSTVVFAAGVGVVVLGAVIVITAPSTSKPRALTIAPAVAAGGGGLSISGPVF
jgi:hypothetical protein